MQIHSVGIDPGETMFRIPPGNRTLSPGAMCVLNLLHE
jgi:hypothetical protein